MSRCSGVKKMRGSPKLGFRLKKRKKALIKVCGIILVLCCVHVFCLDYYKYKRLTTPTPPIAIIKKPVSEKLKGKQSVNNQSTFFKIPSKTEFRMNWIKHKIESIEKHSEKWNIMNLLNRTVPLSRPSSRVHIFYFTFYRNLEIDGQWKHWNKESSTTIDIKTKNDNLHVTGSFIPPMSIGSSYYPMLGCYSSRDPQIIKIHFKQILDAGVGVVIVFWLIKETINNASEDVFNKLLNEAERNHLKIAFCIEAFSNSNAQELLKNIHFITKYYSTHPAFYKLKKNGRYLPVYYLYNSHLTPAFEWRKLLTREGSLSVRGTPYDGFFIGVLIDVHHKYEITRSHFDGFYTYFASNGCYYGSSWKNWKSLEEFAKKNQLLFFPTVSPGYIDTKVRPWNTALTRHRSHGHYYQVAWRSAISAKPFGVSITSYNNWEEGSQIEPAKSKVTPQFTYLDYHPEGPFFYLNLTRYWVKQMVLKSK